MVILVSTAVLVFGTNLQRILLCVLEEPSFKNLRRVFWRVLQCNDDISKFVKCLFRRRGNFVILLLQAVRVVLQRMFWIQTEMWECSKMYQVKNSYWTENYLFMTFVLYYDGIGTYKSCDPPMFPIFYLFKLCGWPEKRQISKKNVELMFITSILIASCWHTPVAWERVSGVTFRPSSAVHWCWRLWGRGFGKASCGPSCRWRRPRRCCS